MSVFCHRSLPVLVLIILFGYAAGCSWGRKMEKESTPQEFYESAMALLQKKKYEPAAEAFKKVKEEFPLSQYTALAEVRGADAVFLDKKYAEAIVLYEEFRKLHPTHPEIPYAIYQMGMSHYKQMHTIDRDQTETEKAIEQFRYLIENYPQSPQAEEGRMRLRYCRLHLAQHEYSIGHFYYRTKKFQAALGRFEGILQRYPDLGWEERLNPLIKECRTKVEREEQKKMEKAAREEQKRKKEEEKKKAKGRESST
ncbi:MAG: outer membrane protein assembly factor BamD [Deltaproteobacteria bacterium]|nr:outer membrane protein assembly factor BamD [Deltaproteobacteria bacterium]